jgi:glycosyltransferase involved in cell wall biosynthesis
MKILFLSTWFPYPPDNGSKLRVYHLLRALSSRHEVALISFAFDTAAPGEAAELSRCCSSVQTVPVNPFEFNRAGSLRTFLSAAPVAFRPIAVMRRLVDEVWQRGAFDAVSASVEVTAAYALTLSSGVPKILEEHNCQTRWMGERYAAQKGMLRRARCWVSWRKSQRYEARLFPQFDLVTMVSEQDRRISQSLLKGQNGRVAVVPNGVDCQHNRPGLAQPQPDRLVYNGSLTYDANYDAMRFFLADIYPRIRQAAPAVSLAITGATQGVDQGGLNLDNSVHLTGYVADVRIPVAEATVCVVPLRQGGGTRLKILEAMALGTPVVATAKGAEGLEVVDGEHLLLADTPEAFAAATLRLLGDPALRARLSVSARRLVEARYDWSAIGRRFVALVEETVARRQTLPPSRDRGTRSAVRSVG